MFALNGNATFTTDFAKYFAGGVPQVLSQAAASGYSPGYSLASLGLVIPVIFVSLGPYPTMQMVGGEIRNPKRSLLLGAVGAEVASIAIFLVLTYLFDHSIGISFLEAWSVTQGNVSTVPSALAMVFYPNAALMWLITVGLFVGNIGWWWLALVFASRIPMAWGFDRVVPTSLAHVSDRFHTPTLSIVMTVLLATVPMALIFFTSFISTQLNAIFLFTVAWLVSAVAAVVLPFRRKAIFHASGGASRFLGLPVISWIGLVSVGVIGYLSYSAFTNPAIGPSTETARMVILAVFAAPAIIYAISYRYNKRRGIDLGLLAAELPRTSPAECRDSDSLSARPELEVETKLTPEEFLRLYERRTSGRHFEEVSPLIADDALFWFNDGSYAGKESIRKAFENTWAFEIRDERYWLDNVSWLAKEERFAVCTFSYHWKVIHEHLSQEPAQQS